MKKILAGLMAAAVVAGVAYADGTTYSQNAVGFISIEAEAGEMVALSVPFVRVNDDTDGGLLDLNDVQFAVDADEGSKVFFWRNQGWKTVTKWNDSGEAFDDSPLPLSAGEFFFFQPKKKMTVVLAGQVPADPTFDVEVEEGKMMSAVANPYPVPFDFANSELGINAPEGAKIFAWKNGSWKSTTKWNDEGEPFDDSEITIEPGSGVIFQGTAGSDINNWEVTKPYDWPK